VACSQQRGVTSAKNTSGHCSFSLRWTLRYAWEWISPDWILRPFFLHTAGGWQADASLVERLSPPPWNNIFSGHGNGGSLPGGIIILRLSRMKKKATSERKGFTFDWRNLALSRFFSLMMDWAVHSRDFIFLVTFPPSPFFFCCDFSAVGFRFMRARSRSLRYRDCSFFSKGYHMCVCISVNDSHDPDDSQTVFYCCY